MSAYIKNIKCSKERDIILPLEPLQCFVIHDFLECQLTSHDLPDNVKQSLVENSICSISWLVYKQKCIFLFIFMRLYIIVACTTKKKIRTYEFSTFYVLNSYAWLKTKRTKKKRTNLVRCRTNLVRKRTKFVRYSFVRSQIRTLKNCVLRDSILYFSTLIFRTLCVRL